MQSGALTPLARSILIIAVLLVPVIHDAYGSHAMEEGPSIRSIPNAPLTASFSFSPSNPQVGQVVTFTGSASGGTSPYTFSWNFGDGGTASGSSVKRIFISLQSFTVTLTVTDSLGATATSQNPVYIGSISPRVNCTPIIVRISDITNNATQNTSFNTSPFSPGITTTVSGGVAKRWLTPGSTPSGWHSPGPACTITNNMGKSQTVFVEIDNIERGSITLEDSSSSYDATNGGSSYPGGSQSDSTFNTFDPAIVSNYGSSCTSASDPTCYGRIHNEMDHDWKAAGYCGTGTTCDPAALSSQTSESSTRIDFQGFVYWDSGSCCPGNADHSFSGWELHPLTGWRVHHNPLTVTISYSPSSPSPGQTVTFTGTASGGTAPYTFTWDFGDGTTGTNSPATHAYAAGGSYNVHLSVTDSIGAVGVVSKTITVNGTPDFSISSNPTSLSFVAGSQATSAINLSSLNSFSGTVSLTPSVSPSGLTALLNPTSVTLSPGGSGSSTLTVSSSSVNNYTVTVTGTSGSLSHTTTVTVKVTSTPTPDFSISTNPTTLTFTVGSQGTSTVNLSSINSFSGSVTLSSTASPAGPTTSLSPIAVTLASGGSGSSTLMVSSSAAGGFTVNVTGTSGSLAHWTLVTVTVNPTGDFSISSNPASLWMQSGSTTTSTIQLSSLNSFSGTITLSSSGMPGGLTAVLNPGSVTLSSGGSASSILSLSSLNPANYTVTVTATSGTLTHTTTVIVTGVSSLVASDAALGPASDFPPGGAKLIQDSAGKMIAVYVDSTGRIGLCYDNSNPMLAPWSTPVKSATPASAYTWPAGVLVSLTSLRIVAGGGAGAGMITDIPVTILRSGGNNITGFTFGTPTTLDSSNGGRYPSAVLAHNGDILLAWAWQNTTKSLVKTLRWDPANGWKNFAGSSSVPDIALLSNASYFVPFLIERPDNFNIYLMANRNPGPPATIAFNKASWNGSVWSWGVQNLTYETNASDADDDPVSMAWDPVRTLVVVAYGITGTKTYGVFTLNAADVKTHNDTPTLAVGGDRGWAAMAVNATSGDYYIFLSSVNTDAGSGPVGYIRLPFGGSWNATINWLDSAADNQALTVRPTGTGPNVDLLFAEGINTAPAKFKFVRLGPFNPPNFSITAHPTSVTFQAGSQGTFTITLTSLNNFTGTINLSATVSPTGPTASFSPTGVTLTKGGTGTSTQTITASASGIYTITITAVSGSLTHTFTVTATVTDVPPTVSLTVSPTSAYRDQNVTLTIMASDADGTIASLRVNWGDGTVHTLAGSATSDTHAYVKASSYTINVTATDNGAMATSSTRTITITDAPPTVSFNATPSTANTGQTVTLAITSHDSDGTITQTVVNWGDGTIHTLTGSATADNHAYVNTGNAKSQSFTITLTVTDNATLTATNNTSVLVYDLPPVASFTKSASTASTGVSIAFNATATSDPDGTIASYSWNFGDGNTGTGKTVSHSYANTGSSKTLNYTITLTVTDNSANTGSANSNVTITDRGPLVSLTETATSAPTGVSITFNATASTDPDGTITNYNWAFGDGATATGAVVSHSYTSTGSSKTENFTVMLTVTDNSGSTGTKQVTETITDRAPTASFTESTSSALTGASITFNATLSSDPDGTVIGYSWGFGDGSTGTGVIASHSYAVAGTYTVTLNVTDNSGNRVSTSFQETILDRPPIVLWSSSGNKTLTLTSISFNATGSYDPDGTIVGYGWNFGDGGTGSGLTATHSYAKAGNYTVVIAVTDNSGLVSTKSFVETILDRPPTASFTSAPASPLTGQTITFDASASSDPDGTVTGYSWSFGDGGIGTGVTMQHSYATNGTFTVILTVTDNSGNKATASGNVVVGADPPPVFPQGSILSPSIIGPRSATLSWTPAQDGVQITSYKLFANGTLAVTLPGNVTSYSVTGLTPLAHYRFNVQAVNPSGNTSTNGPSTSVFTHIIGDVNLDCKVDITDLTLVAIDFGTRVGDARYNPNADVNGDGVIDVSDLTIVGAHFGQVC